MISTKLYSIVLITLFGLIVFNSLEYAAGGDDEVAKTEGEKTEEVKADDGHKCEGDNCTTCTDNSKTEEVKDDGHKCEGDNCTTCKDDSKVEKAKDDGHKCEGDNCTTCTDNSKAEKAKDDGHKCEGDKCTTCDGGSKAAEVKKPSGNGRLVPTVKMGENGEVIDIATGKVITLTRKGMELREAEEFRKKEIEANNAEIETRKECINILKKFNFNGVMTHDAFEVDFKIDNPGDDLTDIILNISLTTEFIRSKEQKENDTSQNYKMHLDYLVTKVVSTETDLLDYYCNKIDPLFRLGFRGDYTEDTELEVKIENGVKKPKAKLLEADKQTYLEFLRLPSVFDYVSSLQKAGITKSNLIFQCALSMNWFTPHVPPSSDDCMKDKKGLGYNGNLLNDNNIIANVEIAEVNPDKEKTSTDAEKKTLPEYALFVKFLSTNKVPSLNKDFLILYCEIIDALHANGFTGKKEDVDHKVTDEKLNAELVNGYTHFIKLPGKSDGEDDLRFKYTLFRISVNAS